MRYSSPYRINSNRITVAYALTSFPKAFHGQPILIFGWVCIDIFRYRDSLQITEYSSDESIAFIVFGNEGVGLTKK